jgi:NAD+-dependent protein deacetylase sirtuin 4
LEEAGVVRGVITQNVDGLHQKAGNRRVVELHGSLAWVRCLGCGEPASRTTFQEKLLAANPSWADRIERRSADRVEPAPDGDAEIDPLALGGFRVPECETCGGVVKPDVVFFGENVPGERVEEAWRLFEEGEVLLVVGSSLTVYSGRRFVYRAQKDGVPIGVVNLGGTRADESAHVKVEGRLGVVLPRLVDLLLNPSAPPADVSPPPMDSRPTATTEPPP